MSETNKGAPLGGNLLHNLLLFGRLLRELGMDVNPGRMIDLVQALDLIEITRRSDFYFALRTLLVHKREHLPLFDRAFELFWRKHGSQWDGADLGEVMRRVKRPKEAIVTSDVQKGPEKGEGGDEEDEQEEQELIEVTQTYSEAERLRQKDFSALSEEEIQQVRQFMARLVWQLGERRTRRFEPGRSARYDLRRLMRRNLQYGGEILEIPRRSHKTKPRPLVIIADVSGSMERYTRLLLYFIYSLSEGLAQHVEAFVFSTRLSRITRQLRNRQLDRALHQVSQRVPDWSGGTRIGQALKTFNFEWGRRVLGRGAVVIIISDGWDRGEPELLAQEMARLQRSCHRLIWLNPLLGSPSYEPLTRGIQAALPYIDDFLPVHNMESLEDLAEHLGQLDFRRRSGSRMHNGHGQAFVISR